MRNRKRPGRTARTVNVLPHNPNFIATEDFEISTTEGVLTVEEGDKIRIVDIEGCSTVEAVDDEGSLIQLSITEPYEEDYLRCLESINNFNQSIMSLEEACMNQDISTGDLVRKYSEARNEGGFQIYELVRASDLDEKLGIISDTSPTSRKSRFEMAGEDYGLGETYDDYDEYDEMGGYDDDDEHLRPYMTTSPEGDMDSSWSHMEDDDDMDDYDDMDDDDMDEATYKVKKVVKGGKVVKRKVRVSGRAKKLSPKQKAVLKKARRKAHTGAAKKARAKSMKVRKSRLRRSRTK